MSEMGEAALAAAPLLSDILLKPEPPYRVQAAAIGTPFNLSPNMANRQRAKVEKVIMGEFMDFTRLVGVTDNLRST
jgi:hypothetical protein